jgi:hypothetical protein
VAQKTGCPPRRTSQVLRASRIRSVSLTGASHLLQFFAYGQLASHRSANAVGSEWGARRVLSWTFHRPCDVAYMRLYLLKYPLAISLSTLSLHDHAENRSSRYRARKSKLHNSYFSSLFSPKPHYVRHDFMHEYKVSCPAFGYCSGTGRRCD